MQAALTGQSRRARPVALVAESLASGELIEPFGPAGRIDRATPTARASQRPIAPEVAEFARWVLAQAELTRNAMEAATRMVKL